MCFENPQISNFIKIRPVGAELSHADGQTDMTKLTVALLFAELRCRVNVTSDTISDSTHISTTITCKYTEQLRWAQHSFYLRTERCVYFQLIAYKQNS